MVAPLEPPRNAEGAQSKGHAKDGAQKARPRTVYDAATGVNVQTSGINLAGRVLGSRQ
jgi:hypothetical protein